MTEQTILADYVNRLNDVSVLCIGDVILDSFVYGEVDRISPEAPVPVLRVLRKEKMLGGSGNVARNLDSLNCNTSFFAAVGDDDAAGQVSSLVSSLKGVSPFLTVCENRPTSLKSRFVANAQQILRADEETTVSIPVEKRKEVISEVEKQIENVNAVILSDYGKGMLTDDVIAEVIKTAAIKNVPVIVDPKGTDYSKYKGAFLVTPNKKEIAEASKMPVGNDEQIVAAARYIIETCGIENVLVTRSKDGMTLVSKDETHHLKAEAEEVFDVSGAGDTVVAVMAASLAGGLSLPVSAKLANAAGAIVVAKVGTAVVYTDELVSYLRNQDVVRNKGKVLSLENALEVVSKWRASGAKIGFTNGCFDLLHPGHISLVSQAKDTCDKLILGLNSDSSVSDLKGPSRPVQSESSRAIVLSSLSDVDMVVIFGEETPIKLIEAFKPDTLVKGADYTVETVVGADFVQSYGGKVVLANLEDGFSTTNTIKRLNQ